MHPRIEACNTAPWQPTLTADGSAGAPPAPPPTDSNCRWQRRRTPRPLGPHTPAATYPIQPIPRGLLRLGLHVRRRPRPSLTGRRPGRCGRPRSGSRGRCGQRREAPPPRPAGVRCLAGKARAHNQPRPRGMQPHGGGGGWAQLPAGRQRQQHTASDTENGNRRPQRRGRGRRSDVRLPGATLGAHGNLVGERHSGGGGGGMACPGHYMQTLPGGYGGVFAQRTHSAGTAPIITLFIPEHPCKPPPQQKRA